MYSLRDEREPYAMIAISARLQPSGKLVQVEKAAAAPSVVQVVQLRPGCRVT
jgi:hypothetical protein